MKLIISILLANALFLVSAETFSLNTADSPPYSNETSDGFYDILLSEVFENLGYDIKINHYPSERSILWANEGHDDGEFARISGISNTFKNLIEINEPLVNFYFVSLKKEGNNLNVQSWDDLKNLRVGYLQGWKIYENNIGEGGNITILHDIDNMFNMLIAGRLDVILYSKLRAEEYINTHDLKGIEIIETPLSIRTMHLYMHNKNSALIPEINRELSRLKESGRYDEIYDQYLIQ